MTQNEPVVQPKAGTTNPQPNETTKEPPGGNLPPSFKVPALQAVFAGQPPAISVPTKSEDPNLKLIWDDREQLMKTGIAFYKALSGDLGVIFNALRLHPEAVKQADKEGRLLEIAPPYTEVEKMVAGAPVHPLQMVDQDEELVPPQPPQMTPPQSANGVLVPPAPAGTVKRLQAERIKSTVPGGPTSGMRPGAGRVLNSLMKATL